LTPDDKNELYTDTALFSKIWTAELMAATGGASKIYFAADGILQQLAIEYMMPDSTRRCHRLTSTRVLAQGRKPLDTSKMLLFGGINYGAHMSPSGEGNDEQAYSFFQPYVDYIVDLPGTMVEVDSVATLRHSDADLVRTGRDATDSAFRAEVSHYPIVLVSTHGFFLGTVSDGTDMRPLVGDNTMSESGLAFAGCRYSLSDTTYDVVRPDGVLSAKEISQLTLDSTDLIVLSACQTGQGVITADGVYGVQRALKQAGVRAMIVSLWSVNDESTSILMRNFFRNLQAAGEDPDVYEAFMKARHTLMTMVFDVFDPASLTTKKVTKYAPPRYSDAFILIDVQ
jgi:CHAT domain-containing protein